MVSRRTRLLIYSAVFVLAVSWYLFRPELAFVDKTVNETFPELTDSLLEEPTTLLQGQFRGVAHATNGAAQIFEFADGRRLLRLRDFSTSNGPDVHVYLVALENALDDESVKNAEFIDLGLMKGNIGDQNYELPAGVDLEKFRSVTIWCKRFGVNFGSAALRL